MSTTATAHQLRRVDLVGHRLAVEPGQQVLDGERRPSARAPTRVAEPMCGATIRFGAWQQRIVGGQRLGVGDVERGAGDLPVVQRLRERLVVDDRAARRVDQDRGRLHQRERVGVDQVAGAGVSGSGSRRSPSGAAGARGRCRRPSAAARHLHPEAGGAPGDRLADPPEADDPERRAVDVGAEDSWPGSHVCQSPLRANGDRLGEPARRRHQQREGEVGGGVGQRVGRVADRDAARGGGVDVDVVVADRVVGDRPQVRAARRSARRRSGR